MKIKRKLWPEALRSKSGIAIIVTVAVLLELISTIQFFYARKGIREDVQHRAESELHVKSLEIRKVMVSWRLVSRTRYGLSRNRWISLTLSILFCAGS